MSVDVVQTIVGTRREGKSVSDEMSRVDLKHWYDADVFWYSFATPLLLISGGT